MNLTFPRLVVAALRGGGGKTTVSLGLISAWRRQGLSIIPFKKGPDYIDAGWLAQAAGQPCYNLDPFLMPKERVWASFAFRASKNGDGAIVEGNRGLFDGADEEGTCSTAELAKLINAPVVLTLDCTKVTRTLAAVVYGCQKFDPDLNIKGVILNKVATSRQENLVRNTIENSTGVKVLGAVPRIRGGDMPERHLGLVPHQEHPTASRVLDSLADLARDYIDLDKIWDTAASAPTINNPPASPWPENDFVSSEKPIKVGVIRDSVFQFYYPENLEALDRAGAEVVAFSSLENASLPEVDALYLGGGFPETHAELLAGNEGLRNAIREKAREGMPIYAECGGLMYLGRELVLNGARYPMAGVFPVVFGLEKKPQGHGYTVVRTDAPNPYFSVGEELVGHEFHYSRPLDYECEEVRLVFDVKRGHGFCDGRDGLVYKNVFAAYTHLHALGTTKWAEALVRLAVVYKGGKALGGNPDVYKG